MRGIMASIASRTALASAWVMSCSRVSCSASLSGLSVMIECSCSGYELDDVGGEGAIGFAVWPQRPHGGLALPHVEGFGHAGKAHGFGELGGPRHVTTTAVGVGVE